MPYQLGSIPEVLDWEGGSSRLVVSKTKWSGVSQNEIDSPGINRIENHLI